MKNIIKISILIILIPAGALAVGIDVDEDIRSNYSLISEEMCHSALQYKLSDSFADSQKKYNDKMSCVFESAFVTATNQLNKEFKDKFFNKIFDPHVDVKLRNREILGTECRDDDLAKTFQAQKEAGYKTLCEVDGRSSVSEKNYSACRVSEVVWNEYCAYQEYLRWKDADRSVVNEFSDTDFNDNQRWNQYRNIEQTRYVNEVTVSARILEETLQQYQVFVQEYRLNLWQLVITEALKVTRAQLKLAAKAISTWPIKFPRASQ